MVGRLLRGFPRCLLGRELGGSVDVPWWDSAFAQYFSRKIVCSNHTNEKSFKALDALACGLTEHNNGHSKNLNGWPAPARLRGEIVSIAIGFCSELVADISYTEARSGENASNTWA